MKSKLICLLGFGLATMLLFIVLNTQPVPAAAPVKDASSNELVVSMLYQGDWRPVGALAFDKTPSEGILDFSGLSPKERWVFLRIQHSGATAAQLDAALIDGIALKRLYNAAGSASLALRKLAQKDYDLVDIHNQTLYLVYEVPTGNPTTLALTARIDPEVLSQNPYQFPLENLYQVMTPDSAFYSYSWDSQPGSLTLDGDLEGESLGKPFVSEFLTPGSGHPEEMCTGGSLMTLKISTRCWISSPTTPWTAIRITLKSTSTLPQD